MVVILLGGGLAVWQQQDKAAEEQVVQGGAQEIKVPKGMKERIILADGTKVWLNSGSCLTLSPGFGQTDRELQLEGEGMFEVAKDKHKPFIIRSGDIRVRVTGRSLISSPIRRSVLPRSLWYAVVWMCRV